jgi:hypothetical protein
MNELWTADVNDERWAINELRAINVNSVMRRVLERLVDSHIATLKDRGVPDEIVDLFPQKRSAIILKMAAVWAEYNFDPLSSLAERGVYLGIPVIPRTYRGIHDLMTMVKNGRKIGYTYLNPVGVFDAVDVPSDPYYVYDVEDGSSTYKNGKMFDDFENILKQQGRFSLTAAEVIALTAHTGTLSRHCVWAVGSRFVSSVNTVLGIYLGVDDRPGLGCFGAGSSRSLWGFPSCGSRS